MSNTFVLPLESLVQRLKAADFEIDAATYYRLQKIVNAFGKEYLNHPDKLPEILSPIVAKSEEEQIRFRDVFEKFYEEILAGNAAWTAQLAERDEQENNERIAENVDSDFQRAARKRRLWVYPFGGLLILLFLILFFKGQPQPQVPQPSKQEITIDKEEKAKAKTPEAADSEKQKQEDKGQEKKIGKVEIVSDVFYPEVGKQVKFRNRYQAENYIYHWFLDDKELPHQGQEVWVTFSEKGIHSIKLEIEDGVAQGYGDSYARVEFRNPNATATMHVLVSPEGNSTLTVNRAQKQAQLERKQFFVKLLFFGLYILLVLGTELYMRWYRFAYYQRAFSHKFLPEKDAPYQLPQNENTHELEPEAAFYALARAMKHPQTSEHDRLDFDATLYETIRAGGYPMLQYSPIEKEAEYLILVDQSAPSEVQAGLFMELMRMLRKEGVHLHIYTFNSDPRTCYVPGTQQEIGLSTLAQRYGMHRLIIFSKGSYMMAPNQREMADWLAGEFAEFEQRILLSPQPQGLWGKREETLASFFLLLPFNTSSQQMLTEAMLDPEHAAFDDLREKVFAQLQEFHSLETLDFEKEENVRAFLGEDVFEWLTSAMLYPKPDWKIIMEVGEALERNAYAGDLLVKDKKGQTLLTIENLSKLASVPWIQQAEWPKALRKELLANMAPATAQQATLAISAALEDADLLQNSAAWKLRETYRTMAVAQAQPENSALQKQMQFLLQHDLLHEKQQTVPVKEMHVGWSERWMQKLWTLWDKADVRLQKALVVVAISFLPTCIGIFSVHQAQQYSRDALFEKYYKSYELKGNETSDIALWISEGCFYLEKEQYNEALLRISKLGNHKTNVKEMGIWYTSLTFMKRGYSDLAEKYLMALAQNPQSFYYLQANDLLGDLKSVWHKVGL